jgi:hypothetical protein
MRDWEMRLVLATDAEPATGGGTHRVQGLIPRDAGGRPLIPASHIKGLLRETLEDLGERLEWPGELLEEILGAGGLDGEDGQPARLRLSDLTVEVGQVPETLLVTRTALAQTGTALASSLRTHEAIPRGTGFTGRLHLTGPDDELLREVVTLGLMSIQAVGGRRRRGAGRCRLELVGEERLPSELIRSIQASLASWRPREADFSASSSGDSLESGAAVWLQLSFVAEGSVCCPEQPVSGNVIRSGPAIPPSAVQGAILTLLSSRSAELATACLQDPRFRAWPLCPTAGEQPAHTVVRVDLAHRMSKLRSSSTGRHEYRDAAVHPYHWSKAPEGSPLKSSDGFLVPIAGGEVGLLRAQDVTRTVQAHGVHHGPEGRLGRDIFTVEALAPTTFSGLVALPPEAAELLIELLAEGGGVSFGKARSVRGSGQLRARPVDNLDACFSGSKSVASEGHIVLVVQSPVAIPDDLVFRAGSEALAAVCAAAGLEGLVKDVELNGSRVPMSQAHFGVRFGWNRHGLGETVGSHRRLRAARVILPGSVLVLKSAPSDLEELLLRGLGDGRERGFGCLAPHPGIATRRLGLDEGTLPVRLVSKDAAGRIAKDLHDATASNRGPSPSQLGALARRVERDLDSARKHLEKQLKRPARAYQAWASSIPALLEQLKVAERGGEPAQETLHRALRGWQALTIIHRGSNQENQG